MKRIALIVALVLLSTAAFADELDRDVLITADGTVYSIVSEPAADGPNTSLALTVQSPDGQTTHSVIPDSVGNGVNVRPTLAYDDESKSLFVMWMRLPNASSSELLVAAYQKETWQSAISIDYKQAVRYNFSVGITRRVQQVQRDGSFEDNRALILHAAWWEQGDGNDGPRYALIGLGGGMTSAADIHDLTDFISREETSVVTDEALNQQLLRHVAVLAGPTPDAVDVLFADPRTHSFYRTTLRPIADVRIHIPVGARPSPPKLGGPKGFSADWSGRTGTITSPDGKTLILSNSTEEKVSYVKFHNGEWSAVQQIKLGKVTAAEAMAALARMAAAE
jgi:hypothetical protein